MATDFKLKYSCSVIPIEAVTLSDGTDVSRVINSNIDKSLGSSIEKSFGATSSLIGYKDSYTFPFGSPITLSNANILNTTQQIRLLFIRIISAAGTGTPVVSVNIPAATYPIRLTGVGDFCVMPFTDVQVTTAVVTVGTTDATTVATMEIIAGLA